MAGKIDVVTQMVVVVTWVTSCEYAVRHPGAGKPKASGRLLRRGWSRPVGAEPVSVLNQAVAQIALVCGTCMCHAVVPRGPWRIREAQQAVLQLVLEPLVLRGHWQGRVRACEVAW